MNPINFKIDQFIASTQEIFDISRNAILDSYPPYSIDLYNYYEKKATPPSIPPFVQLNPSILIEPVIKYNFTKINIPDAKEYNFINGTHNCDFFNTSLEYDLDLENIPDKDIVMNMESGKGIYNFIDAYSPEISGIWRPAIIYIDPMNSGNRITSVDNSFSAKDNVYEAGLCIENFMEVQNPVFKNWTVSGDVKFRVDWKIPKTSFVTVATLGILFWYRYYDVDREKNAGQGFVLPEIGIETATSTSYPTYDLTSDGFDLTLSEQHNDTLYSSSISPAYNPLLSRYGTSDEYKLGQKVKIIEDKGTPKEKNTIYEVTDQQWVCLGEERFFRDTEDRRIDIYIPDEQLYMHWFSTVDLEDYKNCCGDGTPARPRGQEEPKKGNNNCDNGDTVGGESQPAKTQYAVFSVVNQNKDRYRSVLNSLLLMTDDITLKRIFLQGKDIYGDISYDSGSSDSVNKYLAVKNLAKILSNSPIQEGVSVYSYSASENLEAILESLDFKPKGSDVSDELREKIKNIYGRLVETRRDDFEGLSDSVSEAKDYLALVKDTIPTRPAHSIIYKNSSMNYAWAITETSYDFIVPGQWGLKQASEYHQQYEITITNVSDTPIINEEIAIRLSYGNYIEQFIPLSDIQMEEYWKKGKLKDNIGDHNLPKNAFLNGKCQPFSNRPIGFENKGEIKIEPADFDKVTMPIPSDADDNDIAPGDENIYIGPLISWTISYLAPGEAVQFKLLNHMPRSGPNWKATKKPELFSVEPWRKTTFLSRKQRALIYSMTSTTEHKAFNSSNMIRSKKDLLKSLIKFKQNRYLIFPEDKESYIESKFTISKPHLYFNLDFEDQKKIGSTLPTWYKQKISAMGLEVYTKLKLPDSGGFEENESESFELSYYDKDNKQIQKNNIPLLSFLDIDRRNGFYNQALGSLYSAFGLTDKFNQKISTERALLSNRSLSGQYFDLDKGLRVTKDRYFMENQTFNNALITYANSLEDLLENNANAKKTKAFLDDRFKEISVPFKSIYPNLKKFYLHRLGGMYLEDITLYTVGRSEWFDYKSGPVPITNSQYFLKKSITSDLASRVQDKDKKIKITFNCSRNLSIKMYGIAIEKLRDETYESAACRPFPNKVPFKSDSIYIYDKVLGYQFNEYNHILSTQFSPPIVAYGGHREETIRALGVSIFDHPKPISSGLLKSPILDEIGIYEIKNDNLLPIAAKNSHYSYANETDQKNDLKLNNTSSTNWRNDLAAVKCFLTPQNFTNEVTFRKGFFHPNKGWLDLDEISNNVKFFNKTAVLSLEDKPCEEFLGYGNAIKEASMTRYEDKSEKKCAGDPPAPFVEGDQNLTVREPLLIYNKRERLNLQQPNLLTVKMDSLVRKFDFITHLSVRLYDFFHDYPKEVRAALFDPLFYRWTSWNIVDTQMARTVETLRCTNNIAEMEKVEKNREKEKNSLLGQWQYKPKTKSRYFLSNNTIFNYEDSFDIKFSSYGNKTAKYANKFDTIIPVQSLDYFIGSSGILRGFWKYATITSGNNNNNNNTGTGEIEDILDPNSPTPTTPQGEDSGESESTWGIHVSDMGVGDTGATCFALQACTGCPIPNYSNSDPYGMFAYNNETFDIPYRSGYNFIANFRNKLHLIPPINIEAPLPIYDNRQFTDINGFSLSCIAQPDTIRPREFVKPQIPSEPVFIGQPFPSIIGLITHIGVMSTLQAAGYNPVYGALGGVWVKNEDLMSWFSPSVANQAYTNPFDVSTAGLTRNERIRRNFANKGFIQIEGSTAEAIRLNSGTTGISSENSPLASIVSSQQTLDINKQYPEGRSSKVLLEVQYKGCLWYNIEADIFRYSPRSSPVLKNKKFHYLKHNEQVSLPENEYKPDKLYNQLSYPGLLLNIQSINQNGDVLYIDGARAYYALKAGESIDIKYRIIKGAVSSNNIEECAKLATPPVAENKRITTTIQEVIILYTTNPIHATPSEVPTQVPDSGSVPPTDSDTIDLEENYSDPITSYGDNPEFIKYPLTKIILKDAIDIKDDENFLEGYVIKKNTNSFLLFDNTISNGTIYSRTENCDPNNNVILTESSIEVNPSASGCLSIHYNNVQDLVKSGRWFDIKNRHTESSISPYIYDQAYSEGGLGWGSKKNQPVGLGVSAPSELLSLRDFDYHFGSNNFCGLVKFTKGYINDTTHTKISRIKFEPRITSLDAMSTNPLAQRTEDDFGVKIDSKSLSSDLYDFISYSGYPKPLDKISNKIFAHNIFSISEKYHSLHDNIFGTEATDRFILDKDLKKYYLPYYDITLGTEILDTELMDSSVPVDGRYSAASGWVELENIMEINNKVVYDDNYYWISIPISTSGILSPSSKIPKAIIQRCSHLDGSYSSSFCSNVCNNSLVGPSWPNKMDDPNPENLSSDSLVYKFDANSSNKCPDVVYETRTTEQSFYMGCGEGGQKDNTRVDVTQVYEVPSAASTFISAKDLFESSTEIKVKFQYFPKKIPTDFRFSLGKNVVNQSQLYFWECYKTNKKNVYPPTDGPQEKRSQTPPFYQILNEMIFRAWFGERQKISIQDNYNRDFYLSQNHYQWIPYDYDDTRIFDRERKRST